MEIIGVHHDGKNIRNAVIDYIDTQHPNLQSLMIEIPILYNDFRENSSNLSPWFSVIAEYYKTKEVKIIEGDIYEWDLMGLSPEEALELFKREPRKFSRQHYLGILKGYFNGKLERNRNEGMDVVFKRDKPEVTVIGALHGLYLKKIHPEVHFSYFTNLSLIERIFCRNIFSIADKTYYIKHDEDVQMLRI